MLEKHIIFGVHITERMSKAVDVQKYLTEYGCNIRTRLGLHEAVNVCSPNGLVILEMVGEENKCHELADKLSAIEGVEVQKMVFDHP
ncbi:MAG: hypothetical protein ACOCVT_02220 [bacterium]